MWNTRQLCVSNIRIYDKDTQMFIMCTVAEYDRYGPEL